LRLPIADPTALLADVSAVEVAVAKVFAQSFSPASLLTIIYRKSLLTGVKSY
jgi:hypothetical protein